MEGDEDNIGAQQDGKEWKACLVGVSVYDKSYFSFSLPPGSDITA